MFKSVLTILICVILSSTIYGQETAASCSTVSLYGQVVSADPKIPLPKKTSIEVLAKREADSEIFDKEVVFESWFCVKIPMFSKAFLLFRGEGIDPIRTRTVDANEARKRHSWPMNMVSLEPFQGSAAAQSADLPQRQRVLRERLNRHREALDPSESNDLFAWNMELYRDEYREDPNMVQVIDGFVAELKAIPEYSFLNAPEFQRRTNLFRAMMARNRGTEWDRSFGSAELTALIQDTRISSGIRASAIGVLASLGEQLIEDKQGTIALMVTTLHEDKSDLVRLKAIELLSLFSTNYDAMNALQAVALNDESAEVKAFAAAIVNKIEIAPRIVNKPDTRVFAKGEEIKKFKGVVVSRDVDSFTMAETTGGPLTTVVLDENTEVKSHKRGAFRGSKEYGQSYILRGLRLEVDGVGNADGALVADKIRFDEQDLRTAQALKSTLDPAEKELNAKLAQKQAEQERMAGQIEENHDLLTQAQAAADAAAESARKAQQTADYANNRINGLDDFDPIKTVTVYFKTGSATLGPQAKATIDEAAAWVKSQNTKGWVMAVIGYADTTGNSQRNIDLSERRANAVIYYIVSKYKMPLNRLVQPFGYGQLEPVAENKIKEGRAKNRRVEIRLMINKGISGRVGST